MTPEKLFPSYLSAPWKREYVFKKKDRSNSSCKICAIVNQDKSVPAWEIYRDKNIIILLNLYPYNPGHLLISPIEHIEDFSSLSDELMFHLFSMAKKAVVMLEHAYSTTSFTIGINTGEYSGRSIKHLHLHIVPRYKNELNFIDLMGTRVLIETLDQTAERLKKFVHLLS